MAITHPHTAVPNEVIASADFNANHTGVIDDVMHGSRGASLHSDSHARQHSVTSTSDHTSTATSGKMLKADANGLPVDATNTNTDVADAVTKKHSQNTDTALGSGCEAADHGAAATDQVVNVCYGTGDPPAANTTTEGTLFVKYTA